jgi:protocatechuate 3,4-dioxygenase beta subunit
MKRYKQNIMKHGTFELGIMLVWLVCNSCNAQTKHIISKHVGGNCEGCEAIYEYGNKNLTYMDTLPLYETSSPKLKISGTVYQKDGKTPAENVIIYIYHTDRQGIYKTKGDETGWAKRHGFIRGWVKTGKDGFYMFHTFKPAPYPNGSESAHIHVTLKEPDKNEYYIDNYLFDDDPLLTQGIRKSRANRGGSGIIKLKEENGILLMKRDIILGKNIPDYE